MRQQPQLALITGAFAILSITQGCNMRTSPTDNDISANVQTALQLNRTGKWEDARRSAEEYLTSSQGLPSSQERCAMLVAAAYSNALLHETARGEAHLRAFSSACAQYPLRSGWHVEAERVRRLLNGEKPEDVYPSAADANRSRG